MKRRQRYSPEFKAQALDLLGAGKPAQEPVRELRVSRNLLYSWRADSRRENAGIQVENDIFSQRPRQPVRQPGIQDAPSTPWHPPRHVRARQPLSQCVDRTDRREIDSRQAARRVSEANQSFMGTLKAEMLRGGCLIDACDARTELLAHIDSHYNIHRRHSALGYLSPAEFEARKLSLN